MSSGAKHLLNRQAFVDHLKRQIAFLERSAMAFDQGAEDEAVRLATVIRVLLHDTRSSTSLLTHLGVKDKVSFVDTAAKINPNNLVSTPGLIMMRMSSLEGGSYVAPLGDLSPGRLQPNKQFKPWWEDAVTKDQHGNLFSRRDYVLTVCDKEGGAHVDRALDAAYAALCNDNTLGWEYALSQEGARPMERNPAFASVRQIAYEVEQTLRQHPLTLGLNP